MFKIKKIVFSISLISILFSSTKALSQTNGSFLFPGDTLQPGQYILSPNGQYELLFTTDGNLIHFNVNNRNSPDWSTYLTYNGTSPNLLSLQPDGSLVIYDSSWKRVWTQNTKDTGVCNGAYISILDNGDFIEIEPRTGYTVWGKGSYTIYLPGFYPCQVNPKSYNQL